MWMKTLPRFHCALSDAFQGNETRPFWREVYNLVLGNKVQNPVLISRFKVWYRSKQAKTVLRFGSIFVIFRGKGHSDIKSLNGTDGEIGAVERLYGGCNARGQPHSLEKIECHL